MLVAKGRGVREDPKGMSWLNQHGVVSWCTVQASHGKGHDP
jgi:hypothetical protein